MLRLSPALCDLPDDDGVEDDERGVGDELENDHLAPECVIVLVRRVPAKLRLLDHRRVVVVPGNHLELEELQWVEYGMVIQ